MSEIERLREENQRLRDAIRPFARAAAYVLRGAYDSIADEEWIGLGWTDENNGDAPLISAEAAYALAQFHTEEGTA